MGVTSGKRRQICFYFFIVLLAVGFSCYGEAANHCNHGHHHHSHDVHEHDDDAVIHKKHHLLPEEIAEEEDLRMMWDHHDYVHKHDSGAKLSGFGLWINAMGCSLLVSLASLICLILLPLLFIQGKPSKAVVDSLALFGAGAMLGDAFLHQLPHAFGGEHSHSHDHGDDHTHGVSHSHSLEDLSTGLSILAGIIIFLIVEKLVRYVEEFSGGVDAWGSGHHHHHHHKHSNKMKDVADIDESHQGSSNIDKSGSLLLKDTCEGKESDSLSADIDSGGKPSEKDILRKRNRGTDASKENDMSTENISNGNVESINQNEPIKSQSNLVFGYLNLFSDGVHNFTDGMALGSAFLLYGSVGGWSRTLFLLAHELPQEIGDFGILVRSGFSVSKALFFNFLSALVALAGTALALMWGTDPGQSSLIEGFTAGGFIYIALGVLAEMNRGTSALKRTAIQLISLVLGMAVALCISLVE